MGVDVWLCLCSVWWWICAFLYSCINALNIDVLKYRCIEVSVYRLVGVLVYWSVGVLMDWCVCVLACLCFVLLR